MRISTNQIVQQGLTPILDQQVDLVRTENQLATGRRVLTPSDDPAAATRILTLRESIATTEQYDANISIAGSRLELEEAALTGIGDLLQRARELSVQANNATQSNETRAGAATELTGILNSLLGLANTRDANNEFIFGGYRSDIQPFTFNGSNYVYNGDQGTRQLQIGASRQVAIGDSGNAVFVDVAAGNGTFVTGQGGANTGTGVIDSGTVTNSALYVADTYTVTFTAAPAYEVRDSANNLVATGTHSDGAAIAFLGIQAAISGRPATGDTFTFTPSSGQDLFTTLQNLIATLQTPVNGAASQAVFTQGVNDALTNLDNAIGHVVQTRAAIGSRLNALEDQTEVNGAFRFQAQSNLTDVEDIDLAEVISRYNQQLVSLQAAQQAFVRLQQLSLLNFL